MEKPHWHYRRRPAWPGCISAFISRSTMSTPRSSAIGRRILSAGPDNRGEGEQAHAADALQIPSRCAEHVPGAECTPPTQQCTRIVEVDAELKADHE
jgi:hypothetical protein